MKKYVKADISEQKSLNDITEKECLEIAHDIFYDSILKIRDGWGNEFAADGWDIFEKYGLSLDDFENSEKYNYNSVFDEYHEAYNKIWNAIDKIEETLLNTLKRYQ